MKPSIHKMLVGEAPDGATLTIVATKHGDHFHLALQADIPWPEDEKALNNAIKNAMSQASLMFGSHHEPVIWKDETAMVQDFMDQLPDNPEGAFIMPDGPLPPHTVQM